MKSILTLTRAFAAILTAVLFSRGNLQAAVLTWDTVSGDSGVITGGSGAWIDASGNWNNGSTDVLWNNVTPDSAIFGGLAGTITLGGGITVGNMTFNAGTGNYTIDGAGNVLTLSSSLITVNTDATIAAILGGSTGLTLAGTNKLVLSAASTFTGDLNINSGTLEISGTGTVLQNNNASTVTVASGATALLSGSANNVLGWGGSGISGSYEQWVVAGTINNTGGAAQTIPFGGIALNGGTLTSSTGNAFFGSYHVNASSGVITANGTGNTISAVDVGIGNTTATISTPLAGDTLTTSSVFKDIGGVGALTKTGAGTMIMTGASTYTGATTISGGALQVDGSLASGSTVGVGTAGALTGSGTVSGNVTLTGSGVINKNGGSIGGTLGVTGGSWNGTGSVTGLVTSSSGTFTIGSGANLTANGNLNVTGGTLASGSSTSTITGSVNYTSASSSTFGGVIAGSGKTLTMNNASSTLTLSGSNTYTGATTISAGTLQIGGGGTTGALSTSSAITNNAALAFNRSNTVTQGTDFASAISGSGSVTQAGSGSLILSGANTYTGATTVSAGVVNIQNAAALGTVAGGTSVSSGAALQIQGGIVVGAEALTLNGTGVSNDGALRTISGTNTYGGLVTLGSSTRINSDAGSTLYLTNTGTITGSGFGLTAGGAGNTTIAGIIGTGTGTLTKDGAGDLYLTGANTYTGTTTISGGRLVIGSGSTTGSLSTSSAIVNNATLAFWRSNTLTQGADFASVISGSGAVSQAGVGTTILNGANTYTGATTVSTGVLNIQNATALGTTAAGTTVLSGTALQIQGGIVVGAEALTLNDTGVSNDGALRNISGTNTYGGLVTLGSSARINSDAGSTLYLTNTGTITGSGFDLTAGGAGNTTIAGIIGTGTGAVTKDGAGDLYLTGANTYTGTTTISGGRLVIGSGSTTGSLSTSSAIVNNATLAFWRSNTLTQGADFASVISGSGAVSQAGVGTTILNGANTYTGATTVSTGVLNIQNATALGTTAAGTTVLSGTALQIQGGIVVGAEALTLNGTGVSNDGALRNISGTNTYGGLVTLGSSSRINSDAGALTLSNTGTITGSGLALTVGGAGNTTINSIIGTGTGTLTKDGAGTLALTAASTYTGVTTISAGTLSVGTIGNGGVAGNLGQASNAAANLVFDGGTLQYTGSTATSDRAFTINAGKTATIDTSNDLTLVGATGAATTGALTKTGSGALILTGVSTYTGTTTISAGTLQVGAGGTTGALASGSAIINNGTLVFNRSNTVTQGSDFNSVISGSGGLTQAGSGTLRLTGSNTFTGNVNVTSGTLEISGTGGILQSSNSATVTIASGATALLSGTSNNALGYNGTEKWVVAGTVNSTGGAAHNVPFGGITLNGGTITSTSGNSTYGSFIQSIFGGVITANGTGNTISAVDFGIQAGATLTLATPLGGDSLTASSVFKNYTGAGALSKTGLGTVKLTGVSTYTGVTTISAGTLSVGTIGNGGVAGNLGQASNAAANLVFDGGTLQYTGSTATSDRAFTINAGKTATIDTSNDLTLVGATGAATTGALTKTGSGALILTGVSTYTGTTTISAGTLQVGAGGTTGALASGSSITNNGTLVFNRSNTVTQGSDFNSVISGTGKLTQAGSGTLVLNGSNTYSGLTTVSTGVLNIRSAGALGTTAAGTSVTSGAALQIQGNITTASEALTLNGTGVSNDGALRNISGNNNYAGLITLGSSTRINSDANNLELSNVGTITGAGLDLTVGGAGNVIISSNIGTGSGALVKDGTGTLTLLRGSSYTGATTVSAGILNLQANAGLGTTAGGTSVSNGATLQLQGGITVGAEALTLNGGAASGQSGALVNVSGSNTYGGAITVAASSSISAASGSTLTLTGGVVKNGTVATFTGGGTINVSTTAISGASANSDVIVDGVTVNLNVANTYNGPTFIRNSGTLNANVANALPTANGRTAVTFDGTGTSVLALGASQSVASLTSAGGATVTLGSNTLTVGSASGSTTFAGSIGGTGGLVKDGASTQILGSNNSYTGATTISAGNLTLQGTYASSGFAISSGATLEFNSASSLDYGTTTFSGAGKLLKTGTGELRWGGNAATFALTSGALIDIQGGLMVGGNFANEVWTNNKSDLNIASGAFFAGVEANVRVNALTGGGTLSTGYSGSGYTSLTVGVDNGGGTFSGSITDGVASLGGYSDFGGAVATGNLTKAGTGTQVLSGANTYSGTTTVSAGILNIQNATGLGTTAAGTSVTNGATLQLQGGITVGAEALTLNGGAASGQTGALVNVSGTNTYGGAITVASSSSISAASGSVLNLTGGVVKNGTVATFNGGGTINVNTTAISGSSANSDLVIDGTTVNLNVANTYNGPTFIRNSATLNANVTNALPTANGRTAVTFDGTGPSVLTLGAAQSVASLTAASAATITLNANTLTVGDASSNTTFAGAIGGTGGLTKDGASTLVLSGSNGYSGTTTVSAGTLSITGDINSSATIAVSGGSLTTSGADKLANAAAVTVSGGTLTVGGSDTIGTLTMSSGTIGGTATLTATTYDLSGGTVNGNLGTGTINSSGTVALNGTAAAGTVNVTAGTLTLGASSAINSATAVSVSGGSLALGASNQIGDSATVTVSGGTLAMGTNNDTISVLSLSSGTVSGSGTLTATTYTLSGGTVNANLGTGTINSSGTVALNGTAAAGTVNVTAGTLTLGASSAINSATTVSVSGGSLALGASNQIGNSATVTVSGGTLAMGTNNDTISVLSLSSGTVSGSGTLTATTYGLSGGTVDANLGTGTINSSGTVALNGTAAAGTVNVTAGTLTLGASSAINSATAVSVSGGSLALGASNQIGNSATVTVSGGTLAMGTNNDTISVLSLSSGTVSGSGTLTATTYGLSGGTVDANLGTGTINSSGTVALNGTAAAGTVNVTAGTLTLGASSAINSATAVSVSGGGSLVLGASNQIGNSATVTVSGGTLAMGTNNDTISVLSLSSGTVSGSGTLTATTYTLSGGTVNANLGTGTINSSGTVALNGTAAAGTVNVTAGTLTLGASSAINSATTVSVSGGSLVLGASNQIGDGATVTVSGGSLAMGANNDTISVLSLSSGTVSGSGTLTATTYTLSGGTVNANLGTGTINSSGTVALNGTAAAGTVNVTAGTLTLGASSAINSATAVSVSGGSLALGASNQIGDSATVTVSGGSLAIGTYSDTVSAVQLTGGNITGTTGVLTSTSTYDVRSGSVSAILGGTVGLTKSTGGTVTLSNSNTYTGTTTVSGGTLTLSGSGQISDNSSVVVSGGTFDIGTVSDTVAGVQLTSGGITGSTGVLTSSSTYDMQNGSVSAILGGSVGLNKTTSGTVTLSGSNTYTGGTSLTNGNLVVNGSIGSSSLTTIDGGTLMGTGTVGAIQLNSGGAINPGGASSAGTLSTGNISIVDGQLHFNIGGTGAGSYDQLNTNGTINLAAGGAGAKLVLDAINGYTATLNNAFTLVSNDLTDAITGKFAKGTFSGTKLITLSGVDYVENVLGSSYYGRINYSGSSLAPGTLASSGNDVILKIVTPEITITESGNNQTDGGTYDFGDVDKVVPSVPLTKTFTIKNDGEVDLMGIVIHTPTGAAASDYTLDLTGTASTLIPGASTTFKITFDPSRIGTRNADIVIDSNDLDENPFNLALTGVGTIARDVSEPWTVLYGGVNAPATRRDGVAMAVAVQKSTTRDEAVAVFATGYTTNAASNRDIYTAKYDPVTGAKSWERIFAGAAGMDDEAAAIAVDANGDVVITGYTTVAANNSDVYVAKYSGADGSLVWERTYAGSGGSFDEGNSIAVHSSGRVLVAGYGRTSSGADMFAAGYSGSDGSVLFERLIEGGGNGDDLARSVAVDSAGDLAIAGYVRGSAKDFRVMKLSGTSGATAWQWNVNGSTNSNDEAFAVAFDSTGQVVATGTVSAANFDLYTVKLTAAGALVWQKQWNSSFNSSDAGYDIAVDNSGNVIVGGTSYRAASVMDGYVAEYAAGTGALVWERRFNGSVSNQDAINSVDLDGLGNVVATGFSYNATPNSDVLTAKIFATDGGLVWEKRYNGVANRWDNGASVAVSPDGNIYVGGYAGSSAGTLDFMVKNYQAVIPAVQTSQFIAFSNPGGPRVAGSDLPLSASASSGLPVKFTIVSGPATVTDSGNMLSFTGAGTVTVRASQQGNSTYAKATPVDQTFSVIKSGQTITFTPPASLASTAQWPLTGLSTSGLPLSYSVQSGPGTITSGVLSFSGAGAVVVRASQAGDARFNAAANVDATITSVNNAPIIILDNIAENWRDRYAGSGAGQGNDLALQLSGNTAVAGFVGGYTTTSTGKDLYLAKYLADGTLVWTVISGTSGNDEAMSVKVDGNGDVLVAGYVTTGTGQDVYVAKYNGGTGARIWSYTYNGTANGNDVGVSLALEGTTNVAVGAYVVSTGAGNDFFAAKLNQSTGAVVWTSVQPRSGTTSDVPVKVAVGTDGGVVLAGASGSDAWTIKLASATGSRIWQQVYNYANKPDAVRGLALDAADNVIIAAYSQGANYDMYTAKYAALDGSLIWGQRYNSSFNSSDAPWDLVVDGNANVFVTGTSYRSASVRDGMTLKYAGLDGALVWEKRFNGSSGGNDENTSISLDGIGNPVISGYTTNSDATTDVYLAKHNKAAGDIRWEKTFDGDNNKNDSIKKVQVDPNGNVWMTGSATNSSGFLEVLTLRHIPSL
ncbi:autotransporter-associated beta strand repeat-containing protein [Prosthecobacter vanneervenii]|uniref:Autotransporter-associated beta strand protein n=1 Tax=Prosthecobacter vanneervenii TaxID=48466 RepID=A0A7W8DHY4_9BACT|nr:autotransporter-associated beta strand repeat-containing protein [Prosthecobacter vanneervenii]MBB5030452.1 autotransporter-associated beta strand protein [Prosthecobacter vanneervenii]